MPPTGDPPAGSAVLADWLGETADPRTFDTLLRRWVRAGGVAAAGVVWPLVRAPQLAVEADPERTRNLSRPPAELFDLIPALRTTPVVASPGHPGRVYALVPVPGWSDGVAWVEPWETTDTDSLRLAVRVIGRSPALAARLGPAGGSDRYDQRLHDAAVIAGRVGHDLNNLLAGVIGFAELARPHLPAAHPAARFVAEIDAVGRKGLGMVGQLHEFARGGEVKPQPGSVVEVIAREVAPFQHEIDVTVPADLPAVALADGPLGILVGNLLRNAVEAVPAAGRVGVMARVVDLPAADAAEYLGRAGPGPHVEVSVRDFGPGVSPDARGHLFADPFFSTKARHRGLGLATAYRIAAAHGGGVRLDPAPPPGTVARVVLPSLGR